MKSKIVFEKKDIDSALQILKDADEKVTDMFEKECIRQMNTEQLMEYISTLPASKSVSLKEYLAMNKKKKK